MLVSYRYYAPLENKVASFSSRVIAYYYCYLVRIVGGGQRSDVIYVPLRRRSSARRSLLHSSVRQMFSSKIRLVIICKPTGVKASLQRIFSKYHRLTQDQRPHFRTHHQFNYEKDIAARERRFQRELHLFVISFVWGALRSHISSLSLTWRCMLGDHP